jgi:hypothetical protein
MSGLLKSSKMFAAVATLFALASLYNMAGSGSTGSAPTRLTVVPPAHETIQSGPAVEPQSAEPARS